MKAPSTISWPIRLLLILAVILLYLCTFDIVYFIKHTAWPAVLSSSTIPSTIFYLLLVITSILYIILLYTLGLLLSSYIIGYSLKFSKQDTRFDVIQQKAFRYFSTCVPHNQYIALLTFCIILSAGFLTQQVGFMLLCQISLLLTIYVLPLRSRGSLWTIGLLLSGVLILTIRLISIQQYSLLHSSTAIGYALFASVALLLLWCVMHYPLVLQQRSIDMLLGGSLACFVCILSSIVLYTTFVTVNCHYAPRAPAVYISATVMQKCNCSDQDFVVHFSYDQQGHTRYGQIPIHPLLYHAIREGQTLSLHLHSGRLGWHWYHDSISQRLPQRAIPAARIIEDE